MRSLVLALVLGLAACSHTPPPAAPSSPPVNLACEYAHSLNKAAPCLSESPRVAGAYDVALVDFGQVLAYCYAGEWNREAKCVPFADLRPREQPKADAPAAPSSPTPAATPSPAATDKPKADPPKKPEAKKPS